MGNLCFRGSARGRGRLALIGCFMCFMALALAAGAATRDEIRADVLEWAGSGPNEMFVVVDFDEATTQSGEFVFGVKFSTPSITGEEALLALDAETGLDVRYTHGAFGMSVDGFTYGHLGVEYDEASAYPEWWTQWSSPDFGSNWTYNGLGVSSTWYSDGGVLGVGFFTGGWPVTESPNGPRRSPLERHVIEWAGEGANVSFVTVDFDQFSTVSGEFVFGVRYSSPSITGAQALAALDVETGLAPHLSVGAFGLSIDGFTYDHVGLRYEAMSAYPEWWTQWSSDDYGATYELNAVGASSLALTHNQTFGCSFFRDGWPATAAPNGPRRAPLERDVIEWAGEGPYTSFVTVDFDQFSTDSGEFVFGVRYSSPSITGAQALEALENETTLIPHTTVGAFGLSIDGFTYTHVHERFQKMSAYPEWWTQWSSDDYGYHYGLNAVGASGLVLTHNRTFGCGYFRDGWPVTTAPNGPRRFALEEDVIEWAGAGHNRAFVVIDFDISSTQPAEFVYGVRFGSDSITGEQALALLEAETGLDYDAASYPFGILVNSFEYANWGNTYRAGAAATPAETCWFWLSRDHGVSYFGAPFGVSDHAMANGDTNAWTTSNESWPPSATPNGPRTAPNRKASAVTDWMRY